MPYKARKLTSVADCQWQGKEDEDQEVNKGELTAATFLCRTDRKGCLESSVEGKAKQEQYKKT